jgi:hypothetical protein
MQAKEARLTEREEDGESGPWWLSFFRLGGFCIERYRLLCSYKRTRGDDTFLQRTRHKEQLGRQTKSKE